MYPVGPVVKSALKGSSVFFTTMSVGLTLYDAFGIFVFGRYEEKFGGPWDNFVLGLQLSVAISFVCTLGYFFGLVAFLRWRRLERPPSLKRGLLAAVVALVLSASGMAGRMAVELAAQSPMGSVSSPIVVFAVLGLLLGLLSTAASWRRGQRLSPPNQSLHRTRPFGPRR